jgi:predicted class III extradiol MEMO1 family dioxygenase
MKRLRHKNALGDLFYSEEKHEEEMAKIDALNKIANQSSSQTNPLIYIIPIAGILVIGIIAAIVLKKKKG